MTKLALGFFLCLLALSPAQAQPTAIGPANAILCNKMAAVTAASATTTAAISGVAGQAIHVCGWEITSNQSAVTTWQMEYGTQGTPCGTPTTVTPAMSITSTAPAVDHAGFASFDIPAGAQVCIVTTGTTVGIQALIFYSQF